MKSDRYYKEDSNGYLVTYSGSTTGTIKENLYTYLNNLKTNTASIVCRNLFTNSHGLCPNENKSNGEKSNGKWSYGQAYNSGGHRPGDNIACGTHSRTAKLDQCSGGSCSHTDKGNQSHPNETHGNGPCGNTTKVDLYCNNKGGV